MKTKLEFLEIKYCEDGVILICEDASNKIYTVELKKEEIDYLYDKLGDFYRTY